MRYAIIIAAVALRFAEIASSMAATAIPSPAANAYEIRVRDEPSLSTSNNVAQAMNITLPMAGPATGNFSTAAPLNGTTSSNAPSLVTGVVNSNVTIIHATSLAAALTVTTTRVLPHLTSTTKAFGAPQSSYSASTTMTAGQESGGASGYELITLGFIGGTVVAVLFVFLL